MNNFKKVLNFMKKEAFYIVLILCLCAIAVTAAFSAKMNADANKVSKNDPKNNITINENSKTDMQNADLVKNDKNKEDVKNKTEQKPKAVANVAEVKFIKPVSDGVLSRAYKETPIKIETLDAFCTLKGVSIKSSGNKPVVAAADGKVTEMGESSDNLYGYYVVISHSNGMKTVYSNLNPSVKVKKDETVKQGQEIGKVGPSALSIKHDSIGKDLQFQVINAKNQQVDPAKYVSFK